MADELMILPPQSTPPRVKRKGHAGHPGSGPKGETCRSCRNKAAVAVGRKTVYKCKLNYRNWTGGPGSDIHLKDPACQFWEVRTDG